MVTRDIGKKNKMDRSVRFICLCRLEISLRFGQNSIREVLICLKKTDSLLLE